MNLLKRRQLLGYFGLFTSSAFVGIGLKKASSLNSVPTQPPNSIKSSEPSSIIAASSGPSLPEFQGISQWLNSAPHTVADLKGSVVLVQFWTFACINCQRTLPYITRWHRQYAGQGLKVIGVHTPEFPFEKEVNNVKQALQRHQITYAVPIDNEYKTWNAYQNNYWPHLFLADRQGFIRYDHIGEGAYDQTEQTIRKLLG